MARAVSLLAILVTSTSRGLAERQCLPSAVPPESREQIDGLDGTSSVPFGMWLATWDSAVLVNHIVKLLAEEAMGYNATFSGLSSSSPAGLYALAGCRAPENFSADPQCSSSPIFVHHVTLEVWGVGAPSAMRKLLAPWPEVIPEDAGSIGYEGVDGMYILTQQREDAYQAEGLALEYYRSFDAKWHRPAVYFDDVSSFDLAELKLCTESRLTYAAGIQVYLDVTGDHDGVVWNHNGSASARCWNGSSMTRGSWWFAPACRSNPALCVPWVTAADGWHLEDAMQKAAVYNMPLAITVAKTFAVLQSMPRKKRSLVYWWQPDASFIDLNPTIMAFPPFNASERAQHIYVTMTKGQRVSKWMHKQLGVRASRLREFILRVSFTSGSIDEMLLENRLRGGSAFEEVACNWVRQNEDIWRSWIPDKTECIPGKGLVSRDGSFVGSRANASACAWCSAGRHSAILTDTIGTTYTCLKCEPGRSQLDPGQPECNPCAAGTFADGNESRECKHCIFGEYTGRAGQSRCDQCLPTFITNFMGATSVEACICPAGFFRDRDQRNACLPCKEGMTCPEGSDVRGYSPLHAARHPSVPLLKPGFWSSGEEPLSVFRCEDAVRCPGSSVPGRACAERFESRSCAACQAGFGLSMGQCAPCASGALQVLLFPVSPLVAVEIAVVAIYFTSGQSYTKWSSWKKGAASAFFITLNHYHVVNIIRGVDAISDGLSSGTFESASVLSDLLTLFNPQCSGMRSFMSTLILNSHSPGVLLLVFVATWLLSLVLGLFRPALRMELNRLFNTYCSLLLTFFTSIADMAFTIFKCVENPNGLHTLMRDRSIICYDGRWNSMVIIGASAIILWCVGFGTAMLYAIYVAPRKFHVAAFRTRWTFLFVRFRPDVHWWSLTIVARGILLSLGLLFIRSGVGQIYWILAMLLLYTYLLVTFRPWRHMLNNSVDNFAQLSLCLICASSFWLAGVSSDGAQTGLVVNLLTANMVLAAAPFIPAVVLLRWREVANSACEHKDTESRLILNAMGLVFEGGYHEQLAFLKGLTEHDFQLLTEAKDVLLMELGHKMTRSGYSEVQLSKVSRDTLTRIAGEAPAHDLFTQSRTLEDATVSGECEDNAPGNAGSLLGIDLGVGECSGPFDEPAQDNADELSSFSF